MHKGNATSYYSIRLAVGFTARQLNFRAKLTGLFFTYFTFFSLRSVDRNKKLIGIARHPADRTYKCTTCAQQFTERRFLEMHFTKSHRNERRLFNCARCVRPFTQKIKKENHEIRCEIRRYECYLCKKYVVTRMTDMQRHMRSHSGEQPFKCPVCNKCFRYKNSLKYHLVAVHSRINKASLT